jgi:hypothetical protein
MTLAVALILIVTGLRPHEKRMSPPARTAAATAAEVQLAAVPWPTTRLAREVSTGRPAAGTGTGRAPRSDRRCIELAAVGTIQAATAAKARHEIRRDALRMEAPGDRGPPF